MWQHNQDRKRPKGVAGAAVCPTRGLKKANSVQWKVRGGSPEGTLPVIMGSRDPICFPPHRPPTLPANHALFSHTKQNETLLRSCRSRGRESRVCGRRSHTFSDEQHRVQGLHSLRLGPVCNKRTDNEDRSRPKRHRLRRDGHGDSRRRVLHCVEMRSSLGPGGSYVAFGTLYFRILPLQSRRATLPGKLPSAPGFQILPLPTLSPWRASRLVRQ